MRISLILAHPDPASFNHAIAKQAAVTLAGLGHQLFLHDLHAEGFDPLLPAREMQRGSALPPLVAAHCAELAKAEGLVVAHPNWWGQPPAILTGWLDRVLRPGVAYEFLEGDTGEGVPQGLLRIKAAVVFNTANTTPQREQDVFGDPLQRIWRDCVCGLCGVKEFHRRTFSVVVTSTPDQRAAWLKEAAALVSAVFGRA